MDQQANNATGVRTAIMTKAAIKSSRASFAELIKRTNQTPVRITVKD